VPEAKMEVPVATVDAINKTLHDLGQEREAINERLVKLETSEPLGEDEEKLRKIIEDVIKQQGIANSLGKRKIEYPVEVWEDRQPRDLIMGDTNDERIREVQKLNDQIFLTSLLTNRPAQNLRSYNELFKPRWDALVRAMDTQTDAEGQDWVPTGWSARLVELIQKRLNVTQLFTRMYMPTATYTFPVEGSDATAYIASEQTADTGQTKFTVSTPGTDQISMTAKKLAARVIFSRDLQEDSIVPIMGYVMNKIARAFSVAIEQAIINGDTSDTHQDSDVTGSTDARKAWTGLRKDVGSSEKVDLSTLNADTILQLLAKLDVQYAESIEDLVLLTSIAGAIKLMLLRDSQNNLLVTTRNELSDQATIVRGYLGQMFNIPVIKSGYVRQNLNASGVYDGSTTTKTIALLFYPDAYVIGDRRQYTTQLLRELYAESDQDAIVASQRLIFKRLLPSSDALSALGYNISST